MDPQKRSHFNKKALPNCETFTTFFAEKTTQITNDIQITFELLPCKPLLHPTPFDLQACPNNPLISPTNYATWSCFKTLDETGTLNLFTLLEIVQPPQTIPFLPNS